MVEGHVVTATLHRAVEIKEKAVRRQNVEELDRVPSFVSAVACPLQPLPWSRNKKGSAIDEPRTPIKRCSNVLDPLCIQRSSLLHGITPPVRK